MKHLCSSVLLLVLLASVFAPQPLLSENTQQDTAVGISTAPTSRTPVPQGVAAIQVRGTVERGVLRIQARPGEIVRHGVLIFSEPSHTLLVSILDRKNSAEKVASIQSAQFAFVTDLPHLESFECAVQKRPLEDDQLAVWIDTDWSDLGRAERLVARALVHADQPFAFSIFLRDDEKTRTLGGEACCDSTCCDKVCGCEGSLPFTINCCVSGKPGCCYIQCDFAQFCDCICCPGGSGGAPGCDPCWIYPHDCN